MLAPKPETASQSAAAQHALFVRQSSWLMFAGVASGFLMWGVHFLGNRIGAAEYGLFGTLLSVLMLVPGGPLQMVLTQQTAKALATGRERELAGILRMIGLLLLGCWAIACVAALVFQQRILRLWDVSDPAAIWIMAPVVLISLVVPLFQGILQGQQNFFWLSWTMVANGVGRLAIAVVVVLALHAGAIGLIVGVLAGTAFSTAIAVWQSRALWRLAPLPFDWRSVLRQVVPLLLGFVFVQFLFTSDTMFVKHYFTKDETGWYLSAGTLSRALIWLVGPLASVMFPRIVHSSARAEKSNLMGVVLLGTAVMAVIGAAGLTFLGPLVVQLVWGKDFVPVAAAVLPWYALAMVPLALANVLVNNLLARSQFLVVPFVFLLAIAYSGSLIYLIPLHHSLATVLKVMGFYNLLLLGVCAWCTWGVSAPAVEPIAPGAVNPKQV